MRQFNKLIVTPLLFSLTSCSSISTNDTILPLMLANGGGKGGNPEVNNINRCFRLKNREKQSCFDIFYPEDINITIYPNDGDIIRLAGRKSSIERREFNLVGKDRFIFYVDTTNVKLPISCNIEGVELSQDRDTLVVDISTKNIADNITLKDGEGKVILDYKVIK